MNSAAVVQRNHPTGLLGAADPPPFEVVNPSGSARAVLVCDHASWAVPAALMNGVISAIVPQSNISAP